MKEKKISISLERNLYDELEKERKKHYEVSRSKIIETALKKYLKYRKSFWSRFFRNIKE